ncbi:DUF6105 family protein [Rhizobium tumorigenes]|uniref:DUF6105 family protein n=1 Tax=Rhizobium tumorigenes TaxID=2041385 RepID=A0AAF1KRS9_9HYPH|nr:DUF6105 family protein [Rhizobium tumorigenes]WFR96533.1 DUF6105 family protein [Rhizobium tumorigenes]
MKWFLLFWGGPIFFLGSWYWLSYYDISFGIFMYTREVHDLTFQVYGKVLGLPPESIPPLVLRAIIIDSLVVFALIGFRKRKLIVAWWQARQASRPGNRLRDSEDSLSSAP